MPVKTPGRVTPSSAGLVLRNPVIGLIMKNTTLFLLALITAPQMLVSQEPAAQPYWNQFRGPNGDGKTMVKNLPVEFSETKNVRWKTPIQGSGWSSPVVWGNQIWLTTGTRNKELLAVCVDLESGKIVREVKVFDVTETPQANSYKHRSEHLNSPATPTPVVEAGRVYVHFGTQGTACLDTKTGKKIWERRDLHCDHIVRPGSSPIVDDESLFVAFDGIDKQFFVALDKNTGKTRWLQERNVQSDWNATLRARGIDPEEVKKEKPGDNKKSFATAKLIEHDGRRQLIAPAAEATISYDPKTGKELWRVHHLGGFNVACRPLFAHGLVYVFTSGLTGHLLAVRPTGNGDVTDTHIAWSTTKSTPHIPSPIIVDDMLFTVGQKGGIARCQNAKTGEEVFRKRLGGSHWASPLYANGNLYFFSKQGDVTVIKAVKNAAEIIARNELDAEFIASPAVAGDSIILRSTTHLYCIAEGYKRTPEQVAASSRKSRKKAATATKDAADLKALAAKLKKAVADGEITKEGIAKYDAAAKQQKGNRKPDVDLKRDDSRLDAFGARLKELQAAGKLTEKEVIELYELVAGPILGTKKPVKQPIDLEALGAKLKAAVADGTMTGAEAMAEYKRAAAKAGGKKMAGKRGKKGSSDSFYSIVIGRLKSKDLELGEFTMQVDYVTSIYGDRALKDTIIGKTVKIVGISGPWIDKVLLMKRGETLKLRSGTLNGTTISLSPKATVLERAAPFDPKTYPIPPENFRGFQGIVIGTIESKSDQGYDMTLRVKKMVKTFDGNKAAKPESIEGRLMNMQGFYNGQFRPQFDDLQIGDTIRVGAAHRVPETDALEVTQVLEEVETE